MNRKSFLKRFIVSTMSVGTAAEVVGAIVGKEPAEKTAIAPALEKLHTKAELESMYNSGFTHGRYNGHSHSSREERALPGTIEEGTIIANPSGGHFVLSAGMWQQIPGHCVEHQVRNRDKVASEPWSDGPKFYLPPIRESEHRLRINFVSMVQFDYNEWEKAREREYIEESTKDILTRLK